MHSWYFRALVLTVVIVGALNQGSVVADVTPQERRSLRALKTRITK